MAEHYGIDVVQVRRGRTVEWAVTQTMTPEDARAVACDPPLCIYCQGRVAAFLACHPHLDDQERAGHARNLARACCDVWAGREPDHWHHGAHDGAGEARETGT